MAARRWCARARSAIRFISLHEGLLKVTIESEHGMTEVGRIRPGQFFGKMFADDRRSAQRHRYADGRQQGL